MQLEKYLETIRMMDLLISGKRTGPPLEFARKLHLSERRTRDYIDFLKDLGAPIAYSRKDQSYIYEDHGRFHIECAFREKKL